MKKLVIITIICIAGLVLLYLTLNKSEKINDAAPVATSTEAATLIVLPQTVTDTVLVKQVIMKKAGWVVARAVLDGKLSQIIDMSEFLPVGTYSDITISLGDFYKKEELIVMVYEDNSDTVFNDLDLPTIDDNGQMIARLVATGENLPSTYTETTVMDPMMGNMAGMAPMPRVRYTNNGFEPKEIDVTAGTMVEFINESDVDMWVASNEHPGHEILPTFDQFKAVKKGSVYRYVFDKSGNWAYHDHLTPAYGGVISVK